MNERELGAAKSAAESWINVATGRPLEGLLEGCSVAVAILDGDGEPLFERRRGPHFDKLRDPEVFLKQYDKVLAKHPELITGLPPITAETVDVPAMARVLEKIQENEDAIQVASAAAEVSRDGIAGGNLPEDGQGVRPSEQGEEAPTASQEEAVEPTPEP